MVDDQLPLLVVPHHGHEYLDGDRQELNDDKVKLIGDLLTL